MSAELGVTDFLSYALTLDLLKAERVDAISAGTPDMHAALRLRQRYLPDLAAVTDIEHRICAGGAVAVFAAARRRSRSRPDRGDYRFRGQDRGQWRRVKRVSLDAVLHPPGAGPKLGTKLLAEQAGILAWAASGAVERYRDGLCDPAAITDATREYRQRLTHGYCLCRPWTAGGLVG